MHTKAPWTIHEDKGRSFANGEVDHGGFRIDAPDVEQLAYVWRSNVRFGSNEPFGAHEAQANARLIAASPELLSALQNLYALVKGECPSLLEDDHHDELVRAAIDKATIVR